MKKPTISFFCPAYKDENSLKILIPKAVSILEKLSSKFEILIVEDGSPDKTAQIADMLALKFKPFVKVVHHKKNKGYGAALRAGFKKVKPYDFIFYTDGDSQYNVGEIKKFIPYINDYDAVIGYRKERKLSFLRRVQTIVFNFIVNILFDIKINDINCSMKIVRSRALKSINLVSDSAFIDAELLIKLNRRGFRVKQIPVTHYDRIFGKGSGGNISVIIKTILEMVFFYGK